MGITESSKYWIMGGEEIQWVGKAQVGRGGGGVGLEMEVGNPF